MSVSGAIDLLDAIEAELVPRKIGVEEFAESSDFCNPPDAPIWMGDLSFRPIGDIRVGNEVAGWQRRSSGVREMTRAIVTHIQRRRAPIVRVTMASGRSFRCTADHLWLTASFGGRERHQGEWFCKPKVGRKLCHVIDIPRELDPALLRKGAWLGGIFDGEGSIAAMGGSLTIAQSQEYNPEICREIESTLGNLGLRWTKTDRAYRLGLDTVRKEGCDAATSQMLTNFHHWCPSIKGAKIADRLMSKRLWRTVDAIVSVESDGEGEVIALTTTTGNYVCNGYASKNCNKPLYPHQKTFLKLVFLEEMTGEEEDTLSHWISGGRTGTEILLSPDIRERRDWLRAQGYKHFRSVLLAGGRRSSKGFMTAIAMGKILYETLQLGDPGTFYGIDAKKDILFSCVAAAESQAREFQYADLVSVVESCRAIERYRKFPTLETEIRISTEADIRQIAKETANGRKIGKAIARLRGKALASNASTLRGSASMVIVIDEMAHMLPGLSKASADSVYEAAEPSLDQFGRDGMIFLNSSPLTKVGMFYDQYTKMMKNFDPTRPVEIGRSRVEEGEGYDETEQNADPRNMAIQFPSWAFYEGYQTYKSKYQPRHKFQFVITASPDWDENETDEHDNPVWSNEDQNRIQQARAKEAENPESYKVERRGRFAEVTDAFLMPHMVDKMFKGRPAGWVQQADGVYLEYQPFRSYSQGEDALNIYRYKIHVDPSSTTAGFGFALAHVETFMNYRQEPEEHVVFDLIKRWKPRDFPGSVIRWKPILDELEFFAGIYFPFEITFDQHQSAEPIQTLSERLQNRNMSTRVYEKVATNELNWKRWEVFKTALYQGLVHGPYDAVSQDPYGVDQELKFLQQTATGGKFPRVDKQDVGPVKTKDMADCVAECTYTLIGNLMANRTRDRLADSALIGGSPGGFSIGGFGADHAPRGGLGPVNLDSYYHSRQQAELDRALRNGSAIGRSRGFQNRSRARY